MIVEDPDAFKAWMTNVLEPMCDADPEALAKYVYALVKKDKSVEELKESMVSQLEVFLQKETAGFVELLFNKLESQGTALTTAGTSTTADQTTVISIIKSAEEIVDTSGEYNPLSSQSTSSKPSSPMSLHVDFLLQSPRSEETLTATEVGTSSLTDMDRTTSQSDNAPNSQSFNSTSLLSTSTTSLERSSPFSSQTSKEQAVYSLTSTLSPDQRNGSLGAALLSVANKRAFESERRSSSSKSRDRKSDSEKEDRGGLIRGRQLRRRDSSLSPPRRSDRSRSRSWDRLQRRSRSRDRERDRSRAWRNKSPPSRRYDRERRRSWSKSPVRRLRSPSRSPPLVGIRSRPVRYRNRSPPLRSRSRSPYDKNDKLSPLSGGGTPTQDSNHGDTDMRLSTTSQSIQSVVSVKDGHYSSKRRCRDFDEKGYCMRGELCPFDHGSDPVVLEDVTLPPALAFPQGSNPNLPPPPGMEVRNIPPPVAATSILPVRAPPILTPLHHRQQSQIRIPHPLGSLEYNPDAPSMEPRMWVRPPFRPQGRSMMHGGLRGTGPGHLQVGVPNFSLQQRELISVPVLEGDNYLPMNPNKRPRLADFASEDISPLKQRFDYGRLGHRRGSMNKGVGQGNCSLELKKIPPGLNNISHLNNHFAKFGKIVNIQVCFEGDIEAALITFSSHAEASSAYKSTEAVLNNRFIKVFWHNSEKEGKQENVPPHRPSAKERLGVPHPQHVDHKAQNTEPIQEVEKAPKVVIAGRNILKTVYIPTDLRKPETKPDNKALIAQSEYYLANSAAAGANLLRSQEIQAAKDMLRKKREEKNKEAQRLTLHLCKRKQGLLEKSVNHQKSLIERLEKGNLSQETRENIVQTIKSMEEDIEMLRQDIKKAVQIKNANTKGGVKVVSPQIIKKTREETQKQILDIELDIFNRQQEGKDCTELQKKALELKTKVRSLALGQAKATRGRGGVYRGRGRGAGVFTAHSSVDHRPTKLLVSGFESDDKEELLVHFEKFGEIVECIWDEVTPALVVNFKTRKEAENAMNKGRNFQDRLLSATWYNPGQQLSMRSSMIHSLLMGEETDEQEEDDEELPLNLESSSEDFLLQDEEEEEDEERTWRR